LIESQSIRELALRHPFSISVLIVTRNRTALLRKALTSLAAAWSEAKGQVGLTLDTHLLINGESQGENPGENVGRSRSDENVTEGLTGLQVQTVRISRPVSPAAGRNILLRKINSDWIFFLDDDVQLPIHFFLNLEKLLQTHPAIDVWGGPNLTPPASEAFQQGSGWMLTQPLVVGPISRRYKLGAGSFTSGTLFNSQFNLMLCNLLIRRSCLQDNGFQPFFKTAEENELIYRLQENGTRVAASDDLLVFHERRSDTLQFLRQIFFYGFGRGQLLRTSSVSKQIIFCLAPVLLIGGLVFTCYFPALFICWLVSLQILYVFQFGRFDWWTLPLPALIWIQYVLGLGFGMRSQAKSTATAPVLETP